MAEKGSGRKLLTLLLVLTALSLAVSLLSLNALYDLAESNKLLKGELATLSGYDQCMEDAEADLLWAKQEAELRREKTVADAKAEADAAWYQWSLGATDDTSLKLQAYETYLAAILNFETKRIAAEIQEKADSQLADAEYQEAVDRCDDMYNKEEEPAPDIYYDSESSSMYAEESSSSSESSSMYA